MNVTVRLDEHQDEWTLFTIYANNTHAGQLKMRPPDASRFMRMLGESSATDVHVQIVSPNYPEKKRG